MREGRSRLCAGAALLLALPGCDRADEANSAVIVTPAEAPATRTVAPPSAGSAPQTDVIERIPATAPPTRENAPPAKMLVRKDFTDPPLPNELKQDGGLKPLPRPPSGGMQGEEKPQ